ncbi:hypothetical protein BTZ20_0786 [Rhodococcus sp. MTM3W5.2]|uniref:hypothetical protein n=1 Tax=Rhodococcus sp. MTM3W5.2 TaxID=1805827 RepID=UPI0009797789|nr:hypothetical protein [Rhodococcus sp. MTM3W5.2]AQA20752.1 hypothetical protein BTZ20_0786 [Rhodococcus sp. MTM3W5.2]
MRIREDGTGFACLSCGLVPDITKPLSQPQVFPDNTRILFNTGLNAQGVAVLECHNDIGDCADPEVLPIRVPDPGTGYVIQGGREFRINPDGKQVAFTQLRASTKGEPVMLSTVGQLQRHDDGYTISDARVVSELGEVKNFTPDGKSVIVTAFTRSPFESNNPDNVKIDLATGEQSRVTYALDYDEDMTFSPNGEWYVVGTGRTAGLFETVSQLERPNFIGPGTQQLFYTLFKQRRQYPHLLEPWLVRTGSEANGGLGQPLTPDSVPDGWDGRMKLHWSPDGSKILFWEKRIGSELNLPSRMVVAHLSGHGTTPPLPRPDTAPTPTWAPPLHNHVPAATELPESRPGKHSGSVAITAQQNPENPKETIIDVAYHDFSDDGASTINGTERAVYTTVGMIGQSHYTADLTSRGRNNGYLRADATAIPGVGSDDPELPSEGPDGTQLLGYIESEINGNKLRLPH